MRSGVSALRFLTLAVTLLLGGAVFATSRTTAPAWIDFMLGMAFGLSIGVQTLVWSSKLRWAGGEPPSEWLGLNLNKPASQTRS